MAEKRKRAEKAGTAILPLVDGGTEDRTAESHPKGQKERFVLTK